MTYTPITVISISTLATLVIVLVVAIISSIQISAERVAIDQFKNYSAAIYKETDGKGEEILSKEFPDADLYKVNIDYFDFETAFGTNSAFVYSFYEEEAMEEIFHQCELELIDGRMPVFGQSEVILHESILQNRSLSIGDKLGSKTIVGVMTGDAIVGFAFYSEEELDQTGYLSPSYIIVTDESSEDDVRETLDGFDTELWQTYTYTALSEELTDEMSILHLIMILIISMIVISLSIAIAALIFTVYSGRYDEFAIMNAMGYKKRNIRKSIIAEITTMSAFSWFLGYGLSLVGMLLVNETIYKDLGQQMPLFNLSGLCYSILLPIISIICAVVPVSRKLSKTDLIGIIERR